MQNTKDSVSIRNKIRAVIFDVDGTLYPNAFMYIKMLPYAIRNRQLLINMYEIRKDLRKLGTIENFYEAQIQELSKRLSIPLDKSQDLINNIFYSEWLSEIKNTPLFFGCVKSIQKIKQAGYKIGIMSDFPTEGKMEALNFPKIWDIEISAEKIGYLKPHPKPFMEFSNQLGIPPDQILYIGNSYKYDIIGAKNVGMLAGHVAPWKNKNTIADLTFYSYGKLLKWLSIK